MGGRGACRKGARTRAASVGGAEGGHPKPPLVPEGLDLRIEALGSVVRSRAWTSAIARVRPRVVVAVNRTRGRGGVGSEGEKTQESTGPVGRAILRAQARGRVRGRSRERTPEGSKASRRANGRVPASPEVSCRLLKRRAGQLARRWGGLTIAGKPRSRVTVVHGCPFAGAPSTARRGARWKPVGQPGGLRAGVTVAIEPAGKQEAVERRHGSSGGESSEGRIPRTSRYVTRPRDSRA
jgi:hypothetical protein